MQNFMLVSVVLTTRNRSELLSQSIRSVLDQKYNYVELIVVDDASSDGTSEVLKNYSDSVIVIRNESPLGPGAARNAGVRAASGQWVLFLDDDDLLHPDQLNELVGLSKHLGYKEIASSPWRKFSVHNEEVELDPVINFVDKWGGDDAILDILEVSRGCRVCGHSILWPYDLIADLLWDENLFTNGDVDLFGRVLLQGWVFRGTTKGMAYYRSHGGIRVAGTQSLKSVVSSAVYRLKWSSILRSRDNSVFFEESMRGFIMRSILSVGIYVKQDGIYESLLKEFKIWGGDSLYITQPPRGRIKRFILEKSLLLGGPFMVGIVTRFGRPNIIRKVDRDEFIEYEKLVKVLNQI